MHKNSGDGSANNEQSDSSSDPPQHAIPLHRSPAVFAALCAIGNEGKSTTNVTQTTREDSVVGRSSAVTSTSKLFPKKRSQTHHRTAPYPRHNPLVSKKLPAVTTNKGPVMIAETSYMKSNSSWESLPPIPQNDIFITKSFSSPKNLNAGLTSSQSTIDVHGDKMQSFAIRNLAKQCTARQAKDVFHAPSENEVFPLNVEASTSKHSDIQRKQPFISSTRHPSFRRLYITQNMTLSERDISLQRHIRSSLNTHGICVIDGFLGEDFGNDVAAEVVKLHSSGDCVKGELLGGKKDGHTVRGDLVTWVDGTENGCKSLGAFCRKMDGIVAFGAGVTSGYNVCGGTKAMAARYPGNGTRYHLHVDNPAKDGRCLTCIYYINKNWETKTMGGTLRMHAQMSGKTANISPVFDRIAIFYSDSRNPHEVLPTYTDRYAVTVWYFDRDERAKALERMEAIARSSPSSAKQV